MNTTATPISHFKKFVVLLLFMSPLLQTYGWGAWNFSFISTLIVSVIYILIYRLTEYKDSQVPRFLIIYILYAIIVHILTASSIKATIPFVWGCRLLLVLMFYGCFDKVTALRIYKFIAVICILFFYFQEITYSISGVRILGISQHLPFALSTLDLDEYTDYFESMSRSASFFSEPSYFAQFLLPLLAIELYEGRNIVQYTFSIVITITLILIRSGCGLLGLGIILIVFTLYTLFSQITSIGHKLLVVLFIMASIVGTALYLQTDDGSEIIERFQSIDSSGGEGADMSAYIRIFRGYGVYADFSTREKIFGTDNPEVIKAHSSNLFMWSKEDDLGGYLLNAFQNVLVRTGIIGVFLWILMLIQLYRRGDITGKTIILCYSGLMLVEALYFSPIMYIYLLMATPKKTK